MAASEAPAASAKTDATRDGTADPGGAAPSASLRVQPTRRGAKRTPVTPDATANAAAIDATSAGSATVLARPPRTTKASRLLSALQAPGGATTAALIEMTGWQAHTLRAALSGLRKAGHAVARRRVGDGTVYVIEDAAQPGVPQDTSTEANV